MKSCFLLTNLFVVSLASCALHADAVGAVKNWYNTVANKLKGESTLQENEAGIATMTIDGTITDASSYISLLQQYARSPIVHGIVVNINSEGGVTGVAEHIFREMINFRRKFNKFIVAFVDDKCLKEAYLIASAADNITTTATARVGNVEVTVPVVHDDASRDVPHIEAGNESSHVEHLPSSDTTAIVHTPAPEEVRVHLQEHVLNPALASIRTLITQERRLLRTENQIWMEGEFSGARALELHMIDRVGSLSDAFNTLFSLIQKRHPHLSTYKVVSL